MTARRDARRAALLVLGLLAGLDLAARAIPPLAPHLPALVAAVFLYLPALVLSRSGPGLDHYGLHGRRVIAEAARGVMVALVILPLFLLGHHAWMTLAQGQHFDPTWHAYRMAPERTVGHPEPGGGEFPAIQRVGSRVVLFWAPQAEWTITVQADDTLLAPSGNPYPRHVVHREGQPGQDVRIVMLPRGATELRIQGTLDGEPIPPTRFTVGMDRAPPQRWIQTDHSLRVPISFSWILLVVLGHLLVVALPEEFFFRGFLQTRLREAGHTGGLRLPGGLLLTRANLLTSTVFSIAHLVIGWDPMRLFVFFPSLLFGLLRERSEGLAACVVAHALFNLMVVFTIPHYVPWP